MTACIVRGNHTDYVSSVPHASPHTHPNSTPRVCCGRTHPALLEKEGKPTGKPPSPPPRALGMSTQKGGGLAVYESADVRLVDVTFDANTATDY
eukprot:3075880-Prymnesium_polylepis.1